MSRTPQLKIAAVAALVCLLLPALSMLNAQPKGKKSYVFRGKVEKVDEKTKRLTVANEKIEGWMDAMTMQYSVDKPDEVIMRVKPGDQITATVYEGENTLYNVKVVPPVLADPPLLPPKKR